MKVLTMRKWSCYHHNMTTLHTDAFDLTLVEGYLESFPSPSVGTMEIYGQNADWYEDWKQFLDQPWNYKLKIFQQAMPDNNVVISGLPVMSMKKLLRVENEGEPIELEPCEAVSISKPEPFEEFKRFKCLTCKEPQVIPREELAGKKTCTCSSPNLIEAPQLKKDSVNSQYIRLQEIQYDGSEMPLAMIGLLKNNLVWSVKFNERVSPIGILRYRKTYNAKTRETEYKDWFEIFGIKKIDPDAASPLTESDIEYIKSEMAKPGYYDKLIRSFAPPIWGMHSFKEALILALASIKLKRPARILIVTDPGMGKSKLVKYLQYVYPKAILTQMGRSTGTGLTVSSERDEETGKRHVGRGALAQAHNGILVMDEIQFGESKQFMMLNDVMESGQIKFAFPGGNVGHIDANAAIVMLSNPHEGTFGTDQSIGEILKFMGNDLAQQMSRIQYVLLRRDKLTSDERRAIARHMAMHNENNPLHMEQYHENWYDESDMKEEVIQIVPGLTATLRTPAERFGTKWIKKILRYVIDNVKVTELSQEHVLTLVDYYMKNRGDVATEVNKMITNRFMEHGQNMATYMARVKGKSKPTDEEILHTMEIMEKSMSVAAWDPKTQTIDTNPFNGSQPKEKIEKMAKAEQFEEAIDKALIADEQGNKKKYFTMDDIIYCCQAMPNTKWKNDIEIEMEIQKRLNHGKLMERYGQGKYTPTT